MTQQHAKVNYFFGSIYKDCAQFVANTCMKIIGIILTIFRICLYLATNCFKCSGAVIVGVFDRWRDSIPDAWAGVPDSFADLWEVILDDIIDHDGIFGMLIGFFKALFAAIKFAYALSFFILTVVFTPIICAAFTVMFLGVEIGLLAAVCVVSAAIAIVLMVAIAILAIVCYIGMGLIACGIAIGFCVTAFFDFIYRRLKKLSNGCPSCQRKFDIPVYHCPSCGAEQTRLLPSKYGILKRECLCGAKMPTTFFNGRQKLACDCPFCKTSLVGGAHTEVWIPVIGGPSAGKTCYINMAISEIDKTVASKYNLDFVSAQGNDLYEENKAIMEQGLLPQKTSDMTMKFYQFNLNQKGSEIGNFISLCDVAGELYAEGGQFEQGGFNQADGYILIVDPLSITDYRTEVEDGNVQAAEYGASDKPMEEIVGLLFTTLDNIQNKIKSKIKPVCSIVFTKCDVPGLDEIIGEAGIEAYLASHPNANRLTALNAICENFLTQYGEANFLQMVKQRFAAYQFFTCSALGHNVDGNGFTPSRVEDGILWVLDKRCPTLSFIKSLEGKA